MGQPNSSIAIPIKIQLKHSSTVFLLKLEVSVLSDHSREDSQIASYVWTVFENVLIYSSTLHDFPASLMERFPAILNI